MGRLPGAVDTTSTPSFQQKAVARELQCAARRPRPTSLRWLDKRRSTGRRIVVACAALVLEDGTVYFGDSFGAGGGAAVGDSSLFRRIIKRLRNESHDHRPDYDF